MFIIDENNNEATAVNPQSFKDLGFKEREHLQEWIRKNSEILGEELLIVREEDNEWDKTNHRLDLLALDKKGNLVVIENKRDEADRSVTAQALEYASFCSTLTKEQIVQSYQTYLNESNSGRDAQEEIRRFLGNDFYNVLNEGDQRIILVAGKFPSEVTSTVMWLLKKHKVKIKCVQVTLYKHRDAIFVDAEQIIPTQADEDFFVKRKAIRQKNKETTEANRQDDETYFKFWDTLRQHMEAHPNNPFGKYKPKKQGWLACASGHDKLWYLFTGRAGVELYINKGRKELTNQIFDQLKLRREEIESKFGYELFWSPAGQSATIKYVSPANLTALNEGDWDKMIEFFVEYMPRFEAAMRDILNEVLADEPNTASMEE